MKSKIETRIKSALGYLFIGIILYICFLVTTSLSTYKAKMLILTNDNNTVHLANVDTDEIYVWEGTVSKDVGEIIYVTMHDNETVSPYDDFIFKIK